MTDACYVYGIFPAGAEIDEPTAESGLGSGVELVEAGTVAAVVEAIDASRPIGTRSDLVAHSSVLDAMARRGAVVPMRFGSVLVDTDAVARELLAPQQRDFEELLAGLRGLSQYTLRARYVLDTVLAEIVAEDPEVAALREQTSALPEDAGHFERVRMGELVSERVQAKRDHDGPIVVEALAPHAHASVVKDASGMDDLIEVACLVADDRRESFEAAAEVLAERFAQRARLRLVGPTAAYDFVGEG